MKHPCSPLRGELSSAKRETEGRVDNSPLPLASLATSPQSGED